MGQIVKLDVNSSSTRTIAYEYDIVRDEYLWKGNVSQVFGVSDQKEINSKETYQKLINDEYREIYSQALEETIAGKQTLNSSYIITLDEENPIKVHDIAAVVDIEGKKLLVGVLTLQDRHGKEKYLEYMDNTDFVKIISDSLENSLKVKKSGVLIRVKIQNVPTFISWHGEDSVNKIMSHIKDNIIKFSSSNSKLVRIGIDEFGLILEDTAKESIHPILNKIHHYVKNYRSPELEEHLRLDSIMSSVVFPDQVDDVSDALNKLYIALSAAEDSHGFYCDYSEAAAEQEFSKEQIKIMYYMKDAVNQDKFCLAFQPIVESHTGKVASYECLLRVKDDEGKVSTAWPVIHIAEKTGFIDVVDHFVLEKVVHELRENKDIELTFNVSNITTDSPKWLANCTKYFSDPEIAKRVTVEITETAAERDLKQTAYFVASLQALGCKVALDDFGAGYTSFRQLKSLSVDMVKIDGMFILDLAENSENLLFIKTLLDFNKCYGLQTIAECVESGEVAKLLMELGVDYMQGYYFGVPNITPSWKE